MNTDVMKKYIFAIGLVCLLAGCLGLIILTIAVQSISGSIGEIIVFLLSLAFVIVIFFASVNMFIKYGMARGIDYSLERQKEKI